MAGEPVRHRPWLQCCPFCRVSFHTDMVHVFVFSEEGDQPLVGFRSYEQDAYTLTLQ